jgi:Omp85 superfamily domain
MEQHPGSAPRRWRAALSRARPLAIALCVLASATVSAAQDAGDEPSPPAPAAGEQEPPAPKQKVSLRSPDDGWFDLSAFLDTSYGFVPIVWPVTEPAIGYGGCAALAFIGKSSTDTRAGFDQPNITGVAGLGTENGTWGAAAMDSRYWMDNQLQTLVQAFGASVNLEFYGIGEDSILKDHPLTYNLQPVGGVVRGKYRIHRSRTWAGLGYLWMTTATSFDAPDETPGLPDFHRDSNVGGLTPSLTFDSRDSIFTPSSGTYLEGGASFYGKWLGGDADFQSAYLVAMQYVPIHRKLVLGVRGDANFSFGRQPFYMRPYIDMRGVAAMQYQGEHAAKLEAELRWQFWKRFSLVAFAGEGIAWIDLDRFDRQRTVTAGGTGFRYELARKYKLHMGVDVAFGPDGAAFYLQFGSAWMRP